MDSENLSDFFESLNNITVLIIGDAILDSYIWGDKKGMSPEAPVPIIHVKKKDYRMGGAANVALNIQALGAKPILCTIIGKDVAGDQLLKCIDENEITKEGILVSVNRSTTIKTRVIANQRHIVRVDEESKFKPNVEDEDQLLCRIEKLLLLCNVVIFEDYDKGVINSRIINKTIALAKKNNIPVVADPKKKNFLSYKEIKLIKPNLKELRDGLKINIEERNEDELIDAVEILKNKLKTNVLVTLSGGGVFIDYEFRKIRLLAYPRNIVDVSGAGDTVASIATLCVALKLEPYIIALLSNLGGGLVCQYAGVVPIKKEELQREVAKIIDNQLH